jgi:2-deoxy-D-gluconate 3-dehydrogenase
LVQLLGREEIDHGKVQQLFDLTGRVAVVTGGPGLLGKEFCRTLAEAGAAVVVVDINEAGCNAVVDSLADQGYLGVLPREQCVPT